MEFDLSNDQRQNGQWLGGALDATAPSMWQNPYRRGGYRRPMPEPGMGPQDTRWRGGRDPIGGFPRPDFRRLPPAQGGVIDQPSQLMPDQSIHGQWQLPTWLGGQPQDPRTIYGQQDPATTGQPVEGIAAPAPVALPSSRDALGGLNAPPPPSSGFSMGGGPMVDQNQDGIDDRMNQLKQQQIQTQYEQDMQNHQMSVQQQQWKKMQDAYKQQMMQQQQMQQQEQVGPPPTALSNWNNLQSTRQTLQGQNTPVMDNPFNQIYAQKLQGRATSGSGSTAAFQRTPSMPTGSLGPSVSPGQRAPMQGF